jgi:hypothetical protein
MFGGGIPAADLPQGKFQQWWSDGGHTLTPFFLLSILA